ncbi:hypothetical protein N9N67_03220 [Bacteriovoracaceae bacterium]|nr:hypothetical protein [Bacteriovoracaceae bacterium]
MQQSFYHKFISINIELFVSIILIYFIIYSLVKFILLNKQNRIGSLLKLDMINYFSFKVKTSEVFYLTFLMIGLTFLWSVQNKGEVISFLDKSTYYLFIFPFFLIRHAG